MRAYKPLKVRLGGRVKHRCWCQLRSQVGYGEFWNKLWQKLEYPLVHQLEFELSDKITKSIE